MKYIPILFSTPMVQAILEGRKTMTRRIIKPDPDGKLINPYFHSFFHHPSGRSYVHFSSGGIEGTCHAFKNPYGQKGDVLWVRENFRRCYTDDGSVGAVRFKDHKIKMIPELEKDSGRILLGEDKGWKPSIHMPKSACRIFLEVTHVRVERLQAITWQDAVAEGCPGYRPTQDEPTHQFQRLWESINGKRSWQVDPWVWVVSFKRIDKPENF